MNNIPDWMQRNENYIPENDRDGFITKSLLSVMSALSLMKPAPEIHVAKALAGPSAPVKLAMALIIIILASCSSNMFFTYTMLAVLLAHMCFLKDRQLLRAFAGAGGAAAFSALLLLPAVFMGSPHTMLTVSLKVFLSVGLLGLMSVTTPWNKITEGLRFYRVPDLFIFTFDLTLKYIVIIGDICVNMLCSLQLRSVGRNTTKKKAFSGILGVTFLKSRHMAEEMCGAMACRGFEGEYTKPERHDFAKSDLLFGLFTLLVIIYFVLL